MTYRVTLAVTGGGQTAEQSITVQAASPQLAYTRALVEAAFPDHFQVKLIRVTQSI